MGSIYKYTNQINGKAYIGKTYRDAETRRKEHLSGRGNQPLAGAFKKYGKANFTYEILHDGIIPEILDSFEIQAIAEHNTVVPNGYNLTHGGEGGAPSEETKRKMSATKKGKTFSEEHRRKISEAQIGKSVSEETRRKMSENNAAKRPEVRRKISEANKRRVHKPHSEETKRKMSEAHKGRPAWNKGKPVSEETRRKMSESRKGEKNPNFGKKHSEETRRKISEALSGDKNPNRGKPHSEEHRRKISEALSGDKNPNRSPHYVEIYQFFSSLPPDMDLKKKRRLLLDKFSDVVSFSAIYAWIQKWQSEM